jgi:hypothetical protein
VKFPVPAPKFPVSSKNFSVLLRREFGRKCLDFLADWAPKSQTKAGIDKIPYQFPY